jgi:repressor LexA
VHQAEDLFMIRVRGDSMVGAAILDGDLVTVRRTEDADKGDIVRVAIGTDAMTLKRFARVGTDVHLCPENPVMDPIVITAALLLCHGPGWLRIIGTLVGVTRDDDGVRRPRASLTDRLAVHWAD